MTRARASLLLTALVTAAAVAESGDAVARRRQTVRLTVGQSKTLRVRGTITRVHVLNPEVADVASYKRNSVTVVGVDGGATELLVNTARQSYKYAITVTRVEVGRLYKRVRSFLRRIENVYPRLVGETILLSGAALTPDDYGRAQRAVQLFGDKVLNLVQFSPNAVEQVNQILRRSGLTDVRARLVGGTLFLEGSVGSPAEMEKVKAILRAYGLNAENLIKVGGGKQILIDVQFIEIVKTGLDSIGVAWPQRFGAGSTEQPIGTLNATVPIKPGGDSTITLNMAAPLTPTFAALNMMLSSGKARLLAQPKLVCGSGKSAEFLVGGEVPWAIVSSNAVEVNFKPFGISLNVTPTADSLGNIQAKIRAEVSKIDQASGIELPGVGSIPGFRTRRFSTFVTVKAGASIVLSGLFSNDEQKAVAKLPLLGHIPILGELFKSRDFREEKTTLVVFVTPKVVSPKHPWVVNTIRDIQKLYGDYEAEVGWQLLD